MKLTSEQVAHFRAHGYVVAPGVMTDADLAPVIDEIAAHLDRVAKKLLAEGKIKNLHENAPFDKRFALLYAQSKEIGGGLDIMQQLAPKMFAFLHNQNLLDAVESLIGPELTCNPIQHLRAKPPSVLTGDVPDYFNNTPWHQDSGVTWAEADRSEIMTCWMPLVDATIENGCMDVMPDVFKGGHRDHVAAGGTTIDPAQLPTVAPMPVPCPKGGVVFMHRHTPHRSGSNKTDIVRWSLDLRYQVTGHHTGRPFHPAFVVRSKSEPVSVMSDYAKWVRDWNEALSKPAPGAHRVKQTAKV